MSDVGQPCGEPDREEPDREAVFATADEETATKECGAARESQET